MLAPQFGELPGEVAGIASWPNCAWGLGFDVRGTREPHWAGDAVTPTASTHFGASGALAWLDRERDLGLVALASRGHVLRLGDAGGRLGRPVERRGGRRVTARVVVLAGGVGGARFMPRPGAASCRPRDVLVVGNVGDDLEPYGLHVSPDLDTVLYTLAG